jgi:hypothetical protein
MRRAAIVLWLCVAMTIVQSDARTPLADPISIALADVGGQPTFDPLVGCS